ncbi:galactose oxidase [Laetiporus sulphureus 93-53]|uniref:Galactose oxidase n=1 Tax=Laetiporus sulphureus 93-53 TaxID=1314785 RepID=A0A165F9Q4_9APHY|nr:galactose oxidase [Laetiporus sulphureus 93-53]KZT08644.1 galactose oxidase [Laetiporus sulphureus 93-53]
MPVARWSLLSKAPQIARSSHCATAFPSGSLIIYGGELKARIPVDSANVQGDGVIKGSVHLFDASLTDGEPKSHLPQGWRTICPSVNDIKSSAESIPDARVGATMVHEGGNLYIWGGRGGVDMAPLDSPQVGIWRGKLKTNTAGGDNRIVWEQIGGRGIQPEPRSYHTAIAHEGRIYIHAGCPVSGRLSGLHSFDVHSGKWQELASGPDPARGGTSLVAVKLEHEGSALLRYGGFSGYELPSATGVLDVYTVRENKWYTVEPAADPIHGHPGARSVHGFQRFQSTSPSLASAVAVLFHGERDASKLGHAGAGTFWDDVWLLLKDKSNDNTEGWTWKKVDILKAVEGSIAIPEGRGWFASAEYVERGNSRIFMHGGLLSSNERSDELWQLEIEQ